MTQLPLIPEAHPARPSSTDLSIVEAVADKLLPQVLEWLKDDGSEADEVRQDLINACDGNADLDGYNLARFLDRQCGYSPDYELVEILDGASHVQFTERWVRMAKWAAEWQIQPTLAVGDKVTFKSGWKEKSGTIKSIDTKHAMYVIDVGESGCPIVNYEDVTKIAQG